MQQSDHIDQPKAFPPTCGKAFFCATATPDNYPEPYFKGLHKEV